MKRLGGADMARRPPLVYKVKVQPGGGDHGRDFLLMPISRTQLPCYERNAQLQLLSKICDKRTPCNG